MAELADALVLGSSVHDVQVQVLLSAPYHVKPNVLIFDSAFGFFILWTGFDSREPDQAEMVAVRLPA